MVTALLADPSRTAPIARRVNSGLQAQFDQLNAAIYYMLVNRDALGLNIPSWQNPINFPMEYTNQPLGFASSNSVPLGFKHNVHNAFNPDEARIPAGQEGAGRWTHGNGWLDPKGNFHHVDITKDSHHEWAERQGTSTSELRANKWLRITTDPGTTSMGSSGLTNEKILYAENYLYKHPPTNHQMISLLEQAEGFFHKLILDNGTRNGVVLWDRAVALGEAALKAAKIIIHEQPVANTDWKYLSDAEKLAQFKLWLDNKTLHITGDTSKEWLTNYIKQAYDKGVSRSYDDVHKVAKAQAGAAKHAKHPKTSKILAKYGQAKVNSLDLYNGGKSSFLRSSFGHPVSTARVELLAARAHNELQGVTEAMKQQLGRALVEGMIRGDNPKKLARTLQNTVADIGKRRAHMIAHTEIIRSHVIGQLDALKALGVTHIKVNVEFHTAEDGKVCRKCSSLNGIVVPIDDAYDLIPLHPFCRCCFLPANVGESRKGQVRSKSRIRRKLTLAGVN